MIINSMTTARLDLHMGRGECLSIAFMPDDDGMMLITGELVTPLATLQRSVTMHPRDLIRFASALVDGVRLAARAREDIETALARIGPDAQP